MSRWKGTQSHRYLLKRRKHHSDFRPLVSQWSLVPPFQTSEVLGQKWCKRSLWINHLNMHWTCIEHSDSLLCNLFVTMMPWNELNTINFTCYTFWNGLLWELDLSIGRCFFNWLLRSLRSASHSLRAFLRMMKLRIQNGSEASENSPPLQMTTVVKHDPCLLRQKLCSCVAASSKERCDRGGPCDLLHPLTSLTFGSPL